MALVDRVVAFRTPGGHRTTREASVDFHEPKSSPPAGPSFRRPMVGNAGTIPPSTEMSGDSRNLESTRDSRSRSSSLSSLASLVPLDAKELSCPTTSIYGLQSTPCPICGEEVDDVFKSDFISEVCKGRRMNFRLQEKFCQAHNARAAKGTWQARQYPEIDWTTLHRRLEKHNQQLANVLRGEVDSHHRVELEERVRSGRNKTAMQSWTNGTHSRSKVGYYGSRGEKIMYVLLNDMTCI